MSNDYTAEPEGGTANNGSTSMSRREIRASNMTGTLPSLGTLSTERIHTSTQDFEQMLQSLHDLFEHDRQVASQPETTRCGICYLHYHVSELNYQDEGFYTCPNCAQNIGHQRLPMIRRQQKL